MAQGTAPSIEQLVNTAVQEYRAKLIDLSSRNPLISFRHSDRSRSHIRIVDEIPEKLFEKLEGGRQLTFDPVPDPEVFPEDESLPLFADALRRAKYQDEEYKESIARLGPNASDRQKKKVERELRNRLRAELGLPAFEPAKDARDRARELGINPEFDLPPNTVASSRRFNDLRIQTLFFRDDLDRKLGALREAARVLLQDAGISALYCAFGFLEYYESSQSDEKRVAPLVFYPVILERELQAGQYRYFIEGRNDEIETNVALRELLEQHGLDIPSWTDSEERNSLELYFSRIERSIRGRPDWKLRRYVTVGLFTFSTLAMYNDLDPEKWPRRAKLESHELIRTLVAGAEVHGSGVAEDYEIDEVKGPEPLLITDADSSQHSAVLDVLGGRNCVIQGPPGTGKSQTITNLIAAAMNEGKSILFVAEKMAALEVVKKRLTAGGLECFCLELHSSKTSKTAVVESLNKRLEYRAPRADLIEIESNLEAVQRARKELVYYVQKTNEQAGKTGFSIREILLGSARREDSRKLLPASLGSTRFADALSVTPPLRNEMLSAARNLEDQTTPLAAYGALADHPWRGLQNSEITEFETDQLLEALRNWQSCLSMIAERVSGLSGSTSTVWPETERGLSDACQQICALPVASEKVREALLSQLAADDARARLRSAVAALEDIIQHKSALGHFVSDPEEAIQVGSGRMQEAADILAILRLREATLAQLREIRTKWEAISNDLSVAADSVRGLKETYNMEIADLDSARAACAGVELLRALPRQLWSQRDSAVLDDSNSLTLETAGAQCALLLKRRSALTETYELSLLPDRNELRRVAGELRAANFLTALFKRDCRRAKQIHRAAEKTKRKRLTRTQIADALLGCAGYMDDEHQFLNDQEIKGACGRHFKGLSTPFPVLAQLNSWSGAVRQRLAAFGKLGDSVRNVAFTASLDQLDRLSASASGSAYEALSRILSNFADEHHVRLDEIATSQADRYSRMSEAIELLDRARLLNSAGVEQLPAIVSGLKQIEQQTRAIESNNLTVGLVGGSVNAAESNLAALKETLGCAEHLITSGLPPTLLAHLFADVSRIESLRRSAEELKEEIQKLHETASVAAELAKLDTRLWCGQDSVGTAKIGTLAARCRRALDNAGALQDYITFLLAEDSARDAALGPVLAAFVQDKQDYCGLPVAVELVFYRSSAEQILNLDPRLKRHSGSAHEQLRKQYQQLDREYLQLQRKRLAAVLMGRSVPAGNSVGRVTDLTELALVQHISGQTRPRIPLRDLFRRAGNAIKALKPCWMMSPMSVAQFLKPGALEFDLVIMDEASQIRPEEALGAIARAKQLVVVGDQMQLPPTPFFQKLSSDGSSDSEEEEDVDVKQESILETAAARFFPPRRLKWHYRSEHGSLISFSNSEFYSDQLTVFPSPHHDHPDYGVKLVSVKGVYGAGVNQSEADTVVEAATDFMKKFSGQSLGIVAVNSKQAELIRERIDRLFAEEPDVEAYRAKWADTLESLFVKNLENVQGDERDVIFVSTVYGKDEAGNFYQRFGPINSEYGHRRLNVLFTRAKKRVVVFTSMVPEEIEDEGRHWGVRVLKGYLRYARDGHRLLEGSGGECDSEFEQWVLEALKASGFDAVPQLGFAGYRIDLAVRHPQKPGTFICGVECDGAAYHSGRCVRERDRLRQEVLERLGWNIYRIWSTDWFRNPSLQSKNLVNHLRRLAQSDEGSSASEGISI